MVEKADLADGLLLELEEERGRWLFVVIIILTINMIVVIIFFIVKIILIVVPIRCDRLKECLEIERAEREEVEVGLGAEVQ